MRNMEICRKAPDPCYTWRLRLYSSKQGAPPDWGLALVSTQLREHAQLRDQGRPGPMTAGPLEGGMGCEDWASSAGKASFSCLHGSQGAEEKGGRRTGAPNRVELAFSLTLLSPP